MNQKHIDEFGAIPQPPRESFGFLQDLRNPLQHKFQIGKGCNPGACTNCLTNGVRFGIDFPKNDEFPETAFDSLRRVLSEKDIRINEDGAYIFLFKHDTSLGQEEYRVTITPEQAIVEASDNDGLRRAIYFLEDRICEAEGKAVMPGQWQRKPFVKHRVSRCFFGPTNRPPFNIDELMNDVDYYPEEYLNKLAHEAINGLWLTMYFNDLPTPLFPERGKDAPKRFAKLRLTVERCLRYGIRIYVFLSEPKLWSDSVRNAPAFDEGKRHPEMMGFSIERYGKYGFFCTSSEKGRQFLRESTEMIFREVPKLGGIINIMLGEDNGSCIAHQIRWNRAEGETCPLCSQRPESERYRDLARLYTDAMHKYNPNAEFIGWFYTPSQTDGTDFSKRLLDAVSQWPEDSTVMFNFESGGHAKQLGLDRPVYDYSLAFVGPSKLFGQVCDSAVKKGAKLQVGCSHEDASVPFIPVPENLYDKYHFMYDHGVSAAMQCWYFGNYPGLMNQAAGALSFEPFPNEASDFLEALARPFWRTDAPLVAKAWHEFSMAYREFPANLTFEWYGPLHQSIAWPMHLFPSDTAISRSWLLNNFPLVSGDRIGECVAFYHTMPETLELCKRMSEQWQHGLE
ncbi:MAG: hypothetical protein J6X55_12890, partial [Victivallales bacterium]|nr:hypothetical protein [Victivallales bacterium]